MVKIHNGFFSELLIQLILMSSTLYFDMNILPGSVPCCPTQDYVIKRTSVNSEKISRSRKISVLKCEVSPRYTNESISQIRLSMKNSQYDRKTSVMSRYSTLIDPANFRNVLLNIGAMRNNYKRSVYSPESAATVIQSVVRMFLVKRRVVLYELSRQDNRKNLKTEIWKNKSCKPKFITDKMQYSKYNKFVMKETHELIVEAFENVNNNYKILYFLFRCCLNHDKDFLSAQEVFILVNKIFYLDSNVDIFSKFMSHPFYDKVCFRSFYLWFSDCKNHKLITLSSLKYVYLYISKIVLCKIIKYSITYVIFKEFYESKMCN